MNKRKINEWHGKYPSFTPINLPGHPGTYLQSFHSKKYATRKMITQGLVDIALLLTNVSQLKAMLGATDYQAILCTTGNNAVDLHTITGELYL
jgi:Ninjurin.